MKITIVRLNIKPKASNPATLQEKGENSETASTKNIKENIMLILQ